MIRSLVLLFALVVVGCSNDKDAASSSDPMDRVNHRIDALSSTGIELNVSPSNFSLKHSAPNVPYGHVKIEYVAYETLVMDVLKDSRNKLLTNEERDNRLFSIPEGGLFKVKIYRENEEESAELARDSADTSNFTYVLMIDGKEVFRKTGTASEPVFIERINHWYNEDVVNLDQEFSEGSFVQLIVLDAVNNIRDEFAMEKTAEMDL